MKVDNLKKLRNELSGLDYKTVKQVYSTGFSKRVYLYKENSLLGFLRDKITSFHKNKFGYTNKYFLRYYQEYRKLSKKFGLKYGMTSNKMSRRMLHWKIRSFVVNTDFNIFGSKFIKDVNGHPFDETFINGSEDVYLGLSIGEPEKQKITFQISAYKDSGASLGKDMTRMLRDIFNRAYINYLINRKLLTH